MCKGENHLNISVSFLHLLTFFENNIFVRTYLF